MGSLNMKIRSIIVFLLSISIAFNIFGAGKEILLHINQDSDFRLGLEFYFDVQAENAFNLFSDPAIVHMLKDKLLSDDSDVLRTMRCEHEKQHRCFFDQASPGGNQAQSLTPELFKEKCAHNPIFLLRECSEESCPFTRSVQNKSRSFCEKTIVNDFVLHNPDTQKKYTIVFFGVGGLFSELAILTRLINKGYKNLKIVLIDKVWTKDYMDDVAGRDYDEDDITRDSVLLDYQLFGALPGRKTNQARLDRARKFNYSFAQFTQWLTTLCDQKVPVSFYFDVNDYLVDCSEDQMLQADVVIGMDYFDGPNRTAWTGPLCDFYRLALAGLKEEGRFYECSPCDLLSNAGGIVSLKPVLRIAQKKNHKSDYKEKIDTLKKQHKCMQKTNEQVSTELFALYNEGFEQRQVHTMP